MERMAIILLVIGKVASARLIAVPPTLLASIRSSKTIRKQGQKRKRRKISILSRPGCRTYLWKPN
ncbi:hypothetical protein SAMN05518866_1716 [Sphingobium sp. YR768]|nr:hypothetical protein SAMN05518866_1716 [Sphingobium sp. YR768]